MIRGRDKESNLGDKNRVVVEPKDCAAEFHVFCRKGENVAQRL
jgi:hypothetical protein